MKRKGGWQKFFFFILSPYYDGTSTTPLKTIGNKCINSKREKEK
jgi:hypothetical protein